jgi:hypothetical protein
MDCETAKKKYRIKRRKAAESERLRGDKETGSTTFHRDGTIEHYPGEKRR